MTYYDRLNAFFDGLEIKPLKPSSQLLYLHILHEFNRLRMPAQIYATDIRLASQTGLTRQAITDAKRQLKNCGLIDFKTDKHNPRAGTRYTLPETAAKKPQDAKIETAGTVISAEIRQTWTFNNDGTPPSETEMRYLAEDVKAYGEEKVKQAIIRAGQKKRGELSVYFYKMQLGDVISGKKESAGNARYNATGRGGNSSAVSERGLYGGIDICPDDD